jgi:hypothetical protein
MSEYRVLIVSGGAELEFAATIVRSEDKILKIFSDGECIAEFRDWIYWRRIRNETQ